MEGSKEKVFARKKSRIVFEQLVNSLYSGMEFKEKLAGLYFRDFSYALIGKTIELEE